MTKKYLFVCGLQPRSYIAECFRLYSML